MPCGLVVKNRSNIRESVSSLIPAPVSSIVTVIVRVSAAYAVVTVIRPPAASASIPLRTRLRNALRSSRTSSSAYGQAGS